MVERSICYFKTRGEGRATKGDDRVDVTLVVSPTQTGCRNARDMTNRSVIFVEL